MPTAELRPSMVDTIPETQVGELSVGSERLELINLFLGWGRKPDQPPQKIEFRDKEVLFDLEFPNLRKPVGVTLEREKPHLTVKHPHQERAHKLDEPYKVYRLDRLKDTRFSFSCPTFHNCLVFKGEQKLIILEDWGGVQELPADLTTLPEGYSFLPPNWEANLKPIIRIDTSQLPQAA